MLLLLWTLWATTPDPGGRTAQRRGGVVVHKSTARGLRLAQVEGGDVVGAVVHAEDAVLAARAQRDELAARGRLGCVPPEV